MKRLSVLIVLLLLAFFMMGMGDLTDKPSGSIPMPSKDFKATITDINSIKTNCSFVSINGKDFLKGKRGAAAVTIPFENIISLKVLQKGDEKEVEAKLKLAENKEINITVDSGADVYGKTDFGTVQIKMHDVETIEFSNVAE